MERAVPQGAPLWNLRFTLAWVCQWFAVLGDGLHTIAVGFWLYHATGRVTAIALALAIRTLVPILLTARLQAVAGRVSGWGGAWLFPGLRAALSGLTGLVILLAPAGAAYAVLACLVAHVLVATGQEALMPSLTDLVAGEALQNRAAAVSGRTMRVAGIAAPLLGGLLLLWAPAGVGLVGDAVLSAVVAVLFVGAGLAGSSIADESPAAASQPDESIWLDLHRVRQYLRTNAAVRALFWFGLALSTVGAGQAVLMSAVGVRVWQAGSLGYALAEASFPIGLAACTRWFPAIRSHPRRGALVGWAYVAAGALAAAASLAGQPGWGALLLAADGAMSVVGIVATSALLRPHMAESTPVLAGYGTLAALTVPLGALLGGLAADLTGLQPVAVGAGLAFVVGPLIAFLFPGGIRSLR